ncbi:hypothetical protein Ferpe_0335 [Fervidobacterium pennivorans DSM 9078]|uniref:Uncharacterized protein n=1 Tax=Fervidobacterium pennivorans (strain DSM 9078 / Ven5) TaxID=771875 RepID=H9UAD3_FERPD|nr:hypothetical protein [Fervidobacterium pennivorans]AFG34476.1 hypothetical protein Ferpe_0335 [Fervidobacterium pennivorans DSM 9078]QIV77814.1 hypothetical protein HER11_01635 [Fervidobacterium pennivorans subsp. keratinolyticus]
MSYVEFIIFLLVASLILTCAFDGYSHVLQHMAYILDTNRKTLRTFHMINYLRFDFHRHSVANPNVKVSQTENYTTFAFNEEIDGQVKRVLYKATKPFEGRTIIYREVYETFGNSYKLINRRTYTLEGLYKLYLSEDKKYLIIQTDYYEKCLIPVNLPNVQILSITVTKEQ